MIKPGIYYDLDEQDYHNNPDCQGLSKSGIDRLLRSPAHFKCGSGEPSKDMVFGSAFHCRILTPEKWDRDVHSQKSVSPAQRCEAADDGAILITLDEGFTILKMADTLFNTRIGAAIFGHQATRTEVSLFWQDESHGIMCKARPDILNLQLPLMADLKTCRNADLKEFAKSCANYSYDTQAYHYLSGAEAVGLPGIKNFLFIACEKTPPYGVAFYRASAEMIENGGRKADAAKGIYARCLREDVWHGYEDKIIDIELPKWATY